MKYKIAELRKAQRYSQRQLAEASGVSRITIALIEEGKTKNASIITLSKIADVLGVSVTDLF